MAVQSEGGVVLRWGEIVSRVEEGYEVRLDDGAPALLPLAETPISGLAAGDRGQFRVEGTSNEGQVILSVVSISGQDSEHAFDREVHRLHRALSSHGPMSRPVAADAPRDSLGEERMEKWIQHVEDALTRLRKRRSKRLNEQV
jgi:hypothetical protein